MFHNALATQCRLCARAASRRLQAASNAVTPVLAPSSRHHQNFGTSARWHRQAPKVSRSKAVRRYPENDQDGKGAPHNGDAPRSTGQASFGYTKKPFSAFKLSSEHPEVPKTGAGPARLDRRAILSALRAKQADLLDSGSDGGFNKRGSMVAILEAMAKRLALDKVELLRLAKAWAREETYPEKIDRKGKGRSTGLDDDLFTLENVERDMEIYGERAIDRAVLSHFLRWIRNESTRATALGSSSTSAYHVSLQLGAIAESLDLQYPGEWFPMARNMKRKIILHVGPTNSGKTYNALCALAKARTGAFGGPLRLLAAEVHNRFNAGTIGGLTPESPRTCNLVTGEEKKIHDELGGLESCTVEMMPLTRVFDVVVIDEIQMIADPSRGSAWTQALLGLRAKELHLCGEPSVVDLIKRIGHSLGDEVEVKTYERLSPLTVAKHSIKGDWSHIRRGDCVVAFSRNAIFDLKTQIQERTGLRVAVAYGGLPPEVREEQAKGFNSPEEENGYDVLVASDAIGMGLNLQIKRVIFTTLVKWDGRQEVPLSYSQVKQIGGRAGRFGMASKSTSASGPDEIDPTEVSKTKTSAAPEAIEEDEDEINGVVTCLNEADMPGLRAAMAAPPQPIQRAALSPLPTHLEQFATLLPHSTTQAHVFEIFPVIATTSPDYFVPSFGNPLKLAETLSGIERLTIGERWLLGNAPVNLRDPEVLQAFETFVKHFSIDESLKVTQWINAQGMSGTLQAYRDADDAYARAKEAAGVVSDEGEKVPGEAAGDKESMQAKFPLPDEVVTFASSTNLLELESLHRCLGLYLWLHNRFALRFPQAAEARLFKNEVQDAIDFVLQHMSPAALAAAERAKKAVGRGTRFAR